MTRKNYLLLALPMLLWGCETLPFRWGDNVDVDSLVAKNSKPAKVPTLDNRVIKITDANKVAEGRLVETKLVEKKISYKVVKGDTIYSLARQNNTTPADLAKLNDLKLTDQLKVGQTITITKKVTENVASTTNAASNDGMTLPKKQTAVEQDNLSASNSGDDNADKPTRFAWPAQGVSILQKFGEGVSQDGVILGGAMGQNILAIAAGQVIYVGTDIKPLGLLVLIKHDNGLVSTYGYLQRSLVKKGDEVKRGQAIAALGQSGSAQRPQLYFEIRKNNKPSNPLGYLPATPPPAAKPAPTTTVKPAPAKTPTTTPAAKTPPAKTTPANPAKPKTGN